MLCIWSWLVWHCNTPAGLPTMYSEMGDTVVKLQHSCVRLAFTVGALAGKTTASQNSDLVRGS